MNGKVDLSQSHGAAPGSPPELNHGFHAAAPALLPPREPTFRQMAFLLCPRTEAFFGGAAGPGKTEAPLMGAVQLVEHPNVPTTALPAAWPHLHFSSISPTPS